MERPYWTIRIPVRGYVTRTVAGYLDEDAAVEEVSEEVAQMLHDAGLRDVQEDVLGEVQAEVVWEPDGESGS